MIAPADALPSQEDYLNVTATEVSLPGSYGADPLQLGSSWTIGWSPAWILQRAPVNFFDVDQQVISKLQYFEPSEKPPSWAIQFPNHSPHGHGAWPTPSVVHLRDAR